MRSDVVSFAHFILLEYLNKYANADPSAPANTTATSTAHSQHVASCSLLSLLGGSLQLFIRVGLGPQQYA
jgi:hypothetical protein